MPLIPSHHPFGGCAEEQRNLTGGLQHWQEERNSWQPKTAVRRRSAQPFEPFSAAEGPATPPHPLPRERTQSHFAACALRATDKAARHLRPPRATSKAPREREPQREPICTASTSRPLAHLQQVKPKKYAPCAGRGRRTRARREGGESRRKRTRREEEEEEEEARRGCISNPTMA